MPCSHEIKYIERRSKLRIKSLVLNDSKKTFPRIIAIKQHEQRQLDDQITSYLTTDVAAKSVLRDILHETPPAKYTVKVSKNCEKTSDQGTSKQNTDDQQNAPNTQNTHEPQDTTKPQDTEETFDTIGDIQP